MLSKLLLKIWPYTACVIAGFTLYHYGAGLNGDVKDLMHNVAAAFFAVPALYIIYDLARRFSQKRLNKEIFDYVKMLVDTEILSIIGQLIKMVHSYEARDISFQGIQVFLSLEPVQVRGLVEDAEYLGFQVFKNWSVTEKNLHEIVQNASIVQRLDDEQVIAVISLIKSVRWLEALQKTKGVFEVTDCKADGYTIQPGQSINHHNDKYPDRYLLLRHLQDDKYVVADFGDFAPYQTPSLLNVCKIQQKHLTHYASAISDTISQINQWLDLTGSEFLLDTKMYRLGIQNQRPPEKEYT